MAGLYLHIPFCTQRCIYCDFYFVTTEHDHSPFVDALCNEMRLLAGRYGQEPIETLYLGGGTPSVLSADDVGRIIETAGSCFNTADLGEVTLELNPEDADDRYLHSIRQAGVNRLSIGIQSFFEDDLRFIGRSHNAQEACDVIPMARAAGFANFSIDLIFGLPGQSAERWKRNLDRAIAVRVPHLSTYSLTIEPKTPLAKQVERGITTPAPEDEMAERYSTTIEMLESAGYEHYEISSFARAEQRARHNQIYWTHENYLGLGPSAHSFWADERSAERWHNVRSLRNYVAALQEDQLPVAERETLTGDALADEYLMLRLRTSDGLDLDTYSRRYDRNIRCTHAAEIEKLQSDQFLRPVSEGRLQLTSRGKQVCDSVTQMLLS